jgi:hypothetical protein
MSEASSPVSVTYWSPLEPSNRRSPDEPPSPAIFPSPAGSAGDNDYIVGKHEVTYEADDCRSSADDDDDDDDVSSVSSLLRFKVRHLQGKAVAFRRPQGKGIKPPKPPQPSSLLRAQEIINAMNRELYYKDLCYSRDIDKLRQVVKETKSEAAIHYGEVLKCHAFLDDYAKIHDLHTCVECLQKPHYLKDKFNGTKLSHYVSNEERKIEDYWCYSPVHATGAGAVVSSPSESALKRKRCASDKLTSAYPRNPCTCGHCTDPNYADCVACARGELCDKCVSPFAHVKLRDDITFKCMCRPCREVRNHYDNAAYELKRAALDPSGRMSCGCRFCRGTYPADMDAIHKIHKIKPKRDRKNKKQRNNDTK